MLSCRDGEFSHENHKWQHGAFTLALLEGFKNVRFEKNQQRETIQAHKKKAGAKLYNFLTFNELFDFVAQRVPYLVQRDKSKSHLQHPSLPKQKSGDRIDNDMPIFWLGH
jgi:hypothetical protein